MAFRALRRAACGLVVLGWVGAGIGLARGEVPGGDARRGTPPRRVGMSARALDVVYERAGELDRLTSLLVSRRGRKVGREYFHGLKPGEPVNVKSASKSVLSALVGIALKEGALDGLDRPIVEYFPYLRRPHVDPRKRSITLRHLLLMRSGLASTSFGNYGAWVTSDDWVRHVLERPVVDPPGQTTRYSTGNSHLVAVILARAVGRDLLEYAREKLFEPMGARVHAWQRDPRGYRFGGNNMYLTARALHRFGRLYLQQGRFRGRQVVPARWVRASTRSRVHDTYHGFPYGYYWWNATYRGYRVDFAWGHGGQFVFVVPRLDLVVSTTSRTNPGRDGHDHLRALHALVRDGVIPAVQNPPPPRGSGGGLDGWLPWG